MRHAKQIWVGKIGDYDGEAFVPGFAQNHTTREKIDPIGWSQNKQIAVVLSVFLVSQPMNSKKCVITDSTLMLFENPYCSSFISFCVSTKA